MSWLSLNANVFWSSTIKLSTKNKTLQGKSTSTACTTCLVCTHCLRVSQHQDDLDVYLILESVKYVRCGQLFCLSSYKPRFSTRSVFSRATAISFLVIPALKKPPCHQRHRFEGTNCCWEKCWNARNILQTNDSNTYVLRWTLHLYLDNKYSPYLMAVVQNHMQDETYQIINPCF